MDKVFKEFNKVTLKLYNLWSNHMIYTWRWWLQVLIAILPWILWVIIRKKESAGRLLYAGFFTMLIATYTDVLGTTLGLWEYPVKLLPIFPPMAPWDSTVMPVTTMIFLQYKTEINPFLKAFIYSFFGAYVLEPLAVILKLYKPFGWKHIYSFIVFFVIYIFTNYIFMRDNFKKI
ncbi:hypothetical protein DE170_003960 [Clostridium acetobutylicum]|nr:MULTISPECIES: CBO0543 family protein [Clostridium]NOV90728.1 hypothetical protein [Clostridium acetobutylicum]NOW16401.1 hypothetical protein [Clostridium acetobutylicum]NRY58671.1 hypothetical protein [Clostridium acetobutylicum]